MATYRISQLADRSGVPATTLRFYEDKGLLPCTRTPAGYRAYTDADLDRVRFISAAKHLGLPLDRIRDLLGVWDGGLCREIRDELQPMVADQIAAAGHRIADLQDFRDRLAAALDRLRELPPKNGPCDPSCAFLHNLHRRAPVLDLHPRLPLDDVSQGAEQTGSEPAIACSLTRGGYQDRIQDWHCLLGDLPRQRTTDHTVTVRLPADRVAAATALVLAEQECCPFLVFGMVFRGGHVDLTLDVPVDAAPIAEELFGLTPARTQENRNL